MELGHLAHFLSHDVQRCARLQNTSKNHLNLFRKAKMSNRLHNIKMRRSRPVVVVVAVQTSRYGYATNISACASRVILIPLSNNTPKSRNFSTLIFPKTDNFNNRSQNHIFITVFAGVWAQATRHDDVPIFSNSLSVDACCRCVYIIQRLSHLHLANGEYKCRLSFARREAKATSGEALGARGLRHTARNNFCDEKPDRNATFV